MWWYNRRQRRLVHAVLSLVVIAVLAALTGRRLWFDRSPASGSSERFQVVAVIDGDTARLTGGDKLRLAHVDTPEKGEPLYAEATEMLRQLVEGKVLRLEHPKEHRDRYGRLLGFAYVDSMSIGVEMLRRGLAYVVLFDQSDYSVPQVASFLEAQREALKNRVGLHGVERHPEGFYLAAKTGLRFHRPGCRSAEGFLEGDHQRFSTREEALYLGLAPCRNCRP